MLTREDFMFMIGISDEVPFCVKGCIDTFIVHSNKATLHSVNGGRARHHLSWLLGKQVFVPAYERKGHKKAQTQYTNCVD